MNGFEKSGGCSKGAEIRAFFKLSNDSLAFSFQFNFLPFPPPLIKSCKGAAKTAKSLINRLYQDAIPTNRRNSVTVAGNGTCKTHETLPGSGLKPNSSTI